MLPDLNISIIWCASVLSAGFIVAISAGCNSSGPSADGGPSPPSCPMPGGLAMGSRDTHCTMATKVEPASCHTDAASAGDDGGASQCPYGDTFDGTESDDDDCKYHVIASTLTPVCEGGGGVKFKVVLSNKADGSSVAGANIYAEVFSMCPPDSGCEVACRHGGPNDGVMFQESPPGTYTGPVIFDAAGKWTVRFHFHPECDDGPTSPHGHAAFHVIVP
jgi:hypothetical protein